MAWVAALIGAAGSYMSAKEANKKKGGSSGKFDNYSQLTPYAGASPLIDLMLAAGTDAFFNTGTKPPPGGGSSRGTNKLLDQLMGMAQGKSPFLEPAGDFYGRMFDDEFGGNAIRSRLDSELQGDINPYVDDFIGDTQGWMNQAAGSFQGGANDLLGQLLGGTRGRGLFSGMGGVGGATPVDVKLAEDPYLKAVLEGEWLNESNPHLQDMIANFNREAGEAYQNETLPMIDAQFAKAGRYGSDAYASERAKAHEEVNEAMQGNAANLLGSTYQFERGNMMDALGLNTDRALAELSAGTQLGSANAAAGASAYNSAIQGRLGAAGLGVDLLGLLSGQSQGMGSLALGGINQYSNDELGRLGLMLDSANGLDSLRLGGLGLAPGLEQARYAGPLSVAQLFQQRDAASNAAAMNRWQWEQNAPWERIRNLMGIAMPIATTFGTGREWGADQRSAAGASSINPWAAAAMGGAGGYMSAGGGGGGKSGGGNYASGGGGNNKGYTKGGF